MRPLWLGRPPSARYGRALFAAARVALCANRLRLALGGRRRSGPSLRCALSLPPPFLLLRGAYLADGDSSRAIGRRRGSCRVAGDESQEERADQGDGLRRGKATRGVERRAGVGDDGQIVLRLGVQGQRATLSVDTRVRTWKAIMSTR